MASSGILPEAATVTDGTVIGRLANIVTAVVGVAAAVLKSELSTSAQVYVECKSVLPSLLVTVVAAAAV